MLKAVLNGPIALIPGDDSDEPGNLLLHGHTWQRVVNVSFGMRRTSKQRRGFLLSRTS
jgi:hypothetical protein